MYLITTLMTIMPTIITIMTFERYENVVAQTDGH